MNARVRPATSDDVPAFLAVKQALAYRPGRPGGFLLGSSPEVYAALISGGFCHVLDTDEGVVGFSIGVPDPMLRASPLWGFQHLVRWDSPPPADLEQVPVGYYDQLAVLPPWRRHLATGSLALAPIFALFEQGHAHVYTTTVLEPVENRAALPFLARVGARRVGQIDEVYPDFGPLVSAVHHVDAADFRAAQAEALAYGRPALQRVWRGAML